MLIPKRDDDISYLVFCWAVKKYAGDPKVCRRAQATLGRLLNGRSCALFPTLSSFLLLILRLSRTSDSVKSWPVYNPRPGPLSVSAVLLSLRLQEVVFQRRLMVLPCAEPLMAAYGAKLGSPQGGPASPCDLSPWTFVVGV